MNMYLKDPNFAHTWDIPSGRDIQNLCWLIGHECEWFIDDWWLTVQDLAKAGF